jgi:hypothetical protein
MTASIAVWSVWCKSCRAAPHHLLEYFLRVAYSHLRPALGHSAPLSHSSYQD